MTFGRNDSLNVLMVNTVQTGGGAGRVGGLLAEALRAAGDTVHAFVRRNPDRHEQNRIHAAGHWREARLAAWFAGRGITDLTGLSSLLWHCRTEYAAADVLHLHNLHGNYLSLLALPLWGWHKPVVWTLHDFWPLTGNCATPRSCTRWWRSCGRCPLVGVYPMGDVDHSRFYRWLKPRLAIAARPHLVTPSWWLADRVREHPVLRRLPLRVIRNPIDCELFAPAADRAPLRAKFGLAADHPMVVMSGRSWTDRFKGPDDAVAALAWARQEVPGLQLLVIGAAGQELLDRTGLTERALPVLREARELADAYACADACLFPSRAENYPLTVLESLACGTPVVAYGVGGIPEQIEHGRTGFVARDGHPQELAAALVQLAKNAAVAREMGRRGREFVVRTSSVSVVAEQYRHEYARTIRVWCRRHGRATSRMRRSRVALRLSRALGWEKPRLSADSTCGVLPGPLLGGAV